MKQTSRVFACWRQLFAVLKDASWPSAEGNPLPVEVLFGDFSAVPIEAVIVIGVPSERPRTEWVTFGAPSQDEEFVLQVWISTRVPGTDQETTVARLEELCDVVQSELRDQDTGRPAGDFKSVVPGVISHAVTQINPVIFPTAEGFGGYAELDVTFKVRI